MNVGRHSLDVRYRSISASVNWAESGHSTVCRKCPKTDRKSPTVSGASMPDDGQRTKVSDCPAAASPRASVPDVERMRQRAGDWTCWFMPRDASSCKKIAGRCIPEQAAGILLSRLESSSGIRPRSNVRAVSCRHTQVLVSLLQAVTRIWELRQAITGFLLSPLNTRTSSAMYQECPCNLQARAGNIQIPLP